MAHLSRHHPIQKCHSPVKRVFNAKLTSLTQGEKFVFGVSFSSLETLPELDFHQQSRLMPILALHMSFWLKIDMHQQLFLWAAAQLFLLKSQP